MKRARVINTLFWLYLWLSQTLNPVATPTSDFWAAKLKQMVTFEPFDDPVRLLGRGMIPIISWFIIDLILRKIAKRRQALASIP
jgi:hypothetical protein